MKIQIEDNIFIESDGVQFILIKYSGSIDANGNEIFKPLGYFSTLQQTIKFIIKMKIMQSSATTIQCLLIDLKRIEKEVEAIIKIQKTRCYQHRAQSKN